MVSSFSINSAREVMVHRHQVTAAPAAKEWRVWSGSAWIIVTRRGHTATSRGFGAWLRWGEHGLCPGKSSGNILSPLSTCPSSPTRAALLVSLHNNPSFLSVQAPYPPLTSPLFPFLLQVLLLPDPAPTAPSLLKPLRFLPATAFSPQQPFQDPMGFALQPPGRLQLSPAILAISC